MLAVQDTGVGMSEGVLSRLFEPFFTTKGPGRGTGLGLSIIYGIVQQAGGFVHVESDLGHGSTFRIYLPAVAETPVAPLALVEPELPKGNETILLVEDEVLVRSLVSKFLHSQGYRVLSAARGSDAIQLAAEQSTRIDLLLSDVVLPNMNGRQIYERLAGMIPQAASRVHVRVHREHHRARRRARERLLFRAEAIFAQGNWRARCVKRSTRVEKAATRARPCALTCGLSRIA